MQIGELARATSTKVTTIRFYEQIGLLETAGRTEGGWRSYGSADVDRLHFIRNGRRLGFAIDEIRSLMVLSQDSERDCSEAAMIAGRHLADVEDRLRQLSALRDALSEATRTCEGGKIADCRILEAIARPAE